MPICESQPHFSQRGRGSRKENAKEKTETSLTFSYVSRERGDDGARWIQINFGRSKLPTSYINIYILQLHLQWNILIYL